MDVYFSNDSYFPKTVKSANARILNPPCVFIALVNTVEFSYC